MINGKLGRFVFGLCVGVWIVAAASAQTRVERPIVQQVKPYAVQLDAVPLSTLVTMLMRDVLRVPYVIAPDVLTDNRPITVNLEIPRDAVALTVVRYLRSMGLTVTLNGGTVYVARGGQFGGANVPSGSPLDGSMGAQTSPAMPIAPMAPIAQASPPKVDHPVMIARLAYRSPGELAQLVRPLFEDITVAHHDGTKPREGAQSIASALEPDALVVSGPSKTLDRVEAFIRAMDTPRPVVAIKGVVLQVSTTTNSSSALNVLASVLGGRVQFGMNSAAPAGDSFVRLAVGGVSAVLSAVSGDGRFHVVAEPSLVASSGSTATLNSGEQVPTLGAVTYSENGQPIRSVVYRDSGVSLTVTPTVRRGDILLDVAQERSAFARTTTGVDDSPTLSKSAVKGTFTIQPGETVAFAGLEERTSSDRKSGIFGGLFRTKARERADSKLVVMLEAHTVDLDTRKQPEFERIPVRGVGLETPRKGAARPLPDRDRDLRPDDRGPGI